MKHQKKLRPRNQIKIPDFYGNPVEWVAISEPMTYEEAVSSKQSNMWLNVMREEMNSLQQNETWILVEKPKDNKIISNR